VLSKLILLRAERGAKKIEPGYLGAELG